MTDFNVYFRRIRTVSQLSDAELVECCEHAGLTVSEHIVQAWLRDPSDPEYQRMTESEFDAFTRGWEYWTDT